MARLKLWKRIVIMVQAGLAACGLILFMLEVFGCRIASAYHDGLMNDAGHVRAGLLILWLILFVCLAGLAVVTFVIALRAGKAHGARLLSLSDENGDGVLLTQGTLEQLVSDALGTPDGVSINKVMTDYSDHQAAVTAEITVSTSVNIPSVTREMQSRVRRQLTDLSGIPVSSVDIKVMSLHVDMTNAWADGGNTIKIDPEEVRAAMKPDADMVADLKNGMFGNADASDARPDENKTQENN